MTDALDLFFADMHPAASVAEKAAFASLMAASREGHLCAELETPISSPYVRNVGKLFYLEKNYTLETELIERLKELSFVKPLDFSLSKDLTDEQQKALELALTNTLTIIEGGPGTGKTFLTSHLVQAIGSHVILTAPTGKAAARLKSLNSHSICGTLHSLLGFPRKKSAYLKADLIIVDESSMIDAELFVLFLRSLQKGQRVVFLGDGNQLPPVESGSFFGDLVDLLPTAHLKKCLRSDRIEVLSLAQAILAGQKIEPHHALTEKFVIQKALEGYTILSPLKEGPFGVRSLNEKIAFYKKEEGVPILITRSDYDIGLYNGETGTLFKTYADFQGRKFELASLPPYELAYALSVHKSQGSEFDKCLVVVPPGSEPFGKEVLYTGVTRAKHSVLLCGDPETIHNTLARSSRRLSGLRARF